MLLLLSLLHGREGLSDNSKSAFSTAHEKESAVLGDYEGKHRLDNVVGRDVYSLERGHERKLSDHHVASLCSINEPLHEIRILDDFWCHNVAALFVIGIFSIGFVIAFQLVQILSVD